PSRKRNGGATGGSQDVNEVPGVEVRLTQARRAPGSDEGIRSGNDRSEVPGAAASRTASLGEGSTQAWPPAERGWRQGHLRQRGKRPACTFRPVGQGSRHQSGRPDRARAKGCAERGWATLR